MDKKIKNYDILKGEVLTGHEFHRWELDIYKRSYSQKDKLYKTYSNY